MENKEETNKKPQNNANITDAIGPMIFVIVAVVVMIVAGYFMK